jgi:hypothetical protein
MPPIEKDQEREDRINDEAIVDAYGPEEQAMGWYYYLDDQISFPFTGECIEARRTSPLKKGEQVTVIGMPPEDDCEHEMFVQIEWQGREMGVPLAQVQPVGADDKTVQAVGDWHYWVKRGYELG